MTSLVIGASGFLGSHVTRVLARRGDDVRVLIRPTSSTRALAGLDLDVRHGDVLAAASVSAAMDGVEDVYYCVVDARPWVSREQLYRTNVEGLRTVLTVAGEFPLRKFVFTSTMGTLPRYPDRAATEEDGPHNWLRLGGDYIRSRVAAEELALDHARAGAVPVVALCVANTYGEGDYLPTPHGRLLRAAARGRLRWYVRGACGEVVGVRDAAEALVLAAEHGRPGERYTIAERFLTTREVHDIAADAVGAPRAQWGVPLTALALAGSAGELARRAGRAPSLTRSTVRLMHVWKPLDHGKAVRELGWQPRPAEEFLAEAAHFFTRERR